MNLVARVKGILLSPKTEWNVIDGEHATAGSLYADYIIPLAAIPAIAGFIGMSLFGFGVLGVNVRVPIGSGLTSAAVQYILGLVGVYALALIIDALAPNFGGQKNPIQALKTATYASTASWVAGILMLLPGLRTLALLGALYSLYLLFLGLPMLMKAPEEKAATYTVVVIVCAVVLFAVMGAIASRMTGYGGMMG